MASMLYVGCRIYIIKVVVNRVKDCCLLNEPTCINGISTVILKMNFYEFVQFS